ncbi:hypothetical protein KFL_003360050 [Klebsormidium nitens]|uniref:Uncharacterized protein n=1 Tax=Klebsormidium nitens TaxID=105231 RepID=A0A1Y1I9E4_KLENI|nr:hypothetical protein KFL_003360050 [Klebsormidium nitens]|eukprot:GAQ87173.1 hypothetical protein KFL_003360050 [Klebsormidium nitens]
MQLAGTRAKIQPKDQDVVARKSLSAQRVKQDKAVPNNRTAVLQLLQVINVKLDNQAPKRHNSYARDLPQALRPIAVTATGGAHPVGSVPQLQDAGGIFPGTVQQLLTLSPAQLDELRAFYNDDFGNQVGDGVEIQRHKFAMYIGW